MRKHTYAEAGVHIDRGDSFARHIASLSSEAVSRSIGGFAGGTPIDVSAWRRPLLLSATDGVGTKLLVARQLGKYDTVGIDLVAMSVNDLAVCGASPIQFLDYIACGRVDEAILHPLIAGIVRGCELAGCTLAGGETAEMPGVYGPNEFDLAGFATGIVEHDELLPRPDAMNAGDLLLGLPSSGVHSNGFSLLRSTLPVDSDLWPSLLEPTRIYVKELESIRPFIKGAAHVTGGAIAGNLARVIPEELEAALSWSWEVPRLFVEVERQSGIARSEMRRVFNMGIGVVLVVSPENADRVAQLVESPLISLGELAHG